MVDGAAHSVAAEFAHDAEDAAAGLVLHRAPDLDRAFRLQCDVTKELGWIQAGWKIGCTSERAQILVTKGLVAVREGRNADAIEFGNRALADADSCGEPALRAMALNVLMAAYDGMGELEQAIECQRESLSIFEELHDLPRLAVAMALAGGAMPREEIQECEVLVVWRPGSSWPSSWRRPWLAA